MARWMTNSLNNNLATIIRCIISIRRKTSCTVLRTVLTTWTTLFTFQPVKRYLTYHTVNTALIEHNGQNKLTVIMSYVSFRFNQNELTFSQWYSKNLSINSLIHIIIKRRVHVIVQRWVFNLTICFRIKFEIHPIMIVHRFKFNLNPWRILLGKVNHIVWVINSLLW